MAIHNRETFLNHIAKTLNRPRQKSTVTKPVWKHQPQWEVLKNSSKDELVSILEEQCKVIHTTFKKTRKKDLSKALFDTIIAYGGESIITPNDERNEVYGLTHLYESLVEEKIDVHFWDKTIGEKNVTFAERANIGITFSDITLAESGTVTLLNNENNSRSISLLPKHYIAIIAKESLVPRMSQATKAIHEQHKSGNKISSCISFVTGPSNSADIELNLVVGVHGPIKATYIVVE